MSGYDQWFKLKDIKPKLKISDFKVGQIVRMEPGYSTNNPYYVEIASISRFIGKGIITNIPGHTSLRIPHGGELWNYHVGRMSIVGNKSTHGHLLKNQKLD